MNPRPRRLRVLRFLPNGWLMTSGPTDAARNLYLTFDDGPHPDHTPALLDLLAEHGAKASFFLVGREVARANTGIVFFNYQQRTVQPVPPAFRELFAADAVPA